MSLTSGCWAAVWDQGYPLSKLLRSHCPRHVKSVQATSYSLYSQLRGASLEGESQSYVQLGRSLWDRSPWTDPLPTPQIEFFLLGEAGGKSQLWLQSAPWVTFLHCFLDCPSGKGEVPLLYPALCIRCLPERLKRGRGREGESGMTPGCLTPPHPLQLPSHSSFKPPSPMMPKLLALVTSPAPRSIQLSGTSGPRVLPGTVERPPLTPQELNNVLTWAVKVDWSRRALKAQDSMQRSRDCSHSQGRRKVWQTCFFVETFLPSP